MRSSANSEEREVLLLCAEALVLDGGKIGTELDARATAAACAGSKCRLDEGGDAFGDRRPRELCRDESWIAPREVPCSSRAVSPSVDELCRGCWVDNGGITLLSAFEKGLIAADSEAFESLRSCKGRLPSLSDFPLGLENVFLKIVPNPPRFSVGLLDGAERSIGICASFLSSA